MPTKHPTTRHTSKEAKPAWSDRIAWPWAQRFSRTLGMATGLAAGRVPGGARPVVCQGDTRSLRSKTEGASDHVRAGRAEALSPLLAVLALAVLGLVSSCKIVPQDVMLPKEVLVAREEAAIQTGKKGWQMPLLSLGGKFEYSRQGTDELITMGWDDQKSFRDAMLAAATVSYSVANAVTTKASEETSRVAAQEATKQKAAAEAGKLEALKEANRHAEALMELEAVPVP